GLLQSLRCMDGFSLCGIERLFMCLDFTAELSHQRSTITPCRRRFGCRCCRHLSCPQSDCLTVSGRLLECAEKRRRFLGVHVELRLYREPGDKSLCVAHDPAHFAQVQPSFAEQVVYQIADSRRQFVWQPGFRHSCRLLAVELDEHRAAEWLLIQY